jgi:hypothetical protein
MLLVQPSVHGVKQVDTVERTIHQVQVHQHVKHVLQDFINQLLVKHFVVKHLQVLSLIK